MMATFWVCNIYILSLVTCLGNAQFLNSIPCSPYPLTFGSNAGFIVPNATDPCVAPLPQLNRVPSAGNKAAPKPGAPPAAADSPDNADTPLPRDEPPSAIPSNAAGAAPVQPLPAAPGVGPVSDDAPNVGENQEKPAPLVKRQAPADPGDGSLPVLPDVNPLDPSLPTGGIPPLPIADPLNGGVPPLPIEDPLAGGVPPIHIADPLTGGVPLVPDVNPPDGLPVDPDAILLPASAVPPFDNAIPPPPTASGGLLCDLSTLIQTLVNAILQFVRNHLKRLIHSIVQLSDNIIRTLLDKLLPDVLKTLEKLLGSLLPNLLKDVGNLVDTALNDLLGKHGLVHGIVNSLSGPGKPLEGPWGNSTKVISAVNGIITDVEELLKDILEVPVVDTVHLLNDVSKLLNNSFEDLLENVDKVSRDPLIDLLGDLSIVSGLSTEVTTLLKDVLGDTVCNVEKLLTNSNLLVQLTQNLLKLIRNLLDDILRDVDKLLVDKLVKLLGKKGLLDKLLDNLLKLLIDSWNNLLAPKMKKLENSQIVKNPDEFKKEAIAKVANSMPGSNVIPGAPLLEDILAVALDGLLEDLIKTVQNLLKNLKELLAGKKSGLINSLQNTIRKLLDTLLENLGIGVGEVLPPALSKLMNPSALLEPLSTVVTNILKLVVCDSCKKPVPPITTLPPVTDMHPVTIVPPIHIHFSLLCFPFYYPNSPVDEDSVENDLYDNINDPDSFVPGPNFYDYDDG